MALRAPRRRLRGVVVAAVVLLLLAVLAFARFYTDVLWFREVGLSSVLWTSIGTQFVVGAVVAAVTAAIVLANLLVATRVAPAFRVSRFELAGRRDPLEHYRDLMLPYVKWLRLGAAALVGLLAGLGAAAAWRTYLLWANRVDFGVDDPQFGRDIGYYFFELPFQEQVLEWLWFALVASLVLSIAAHLLQGSIRPEAGLAGVLPGALAHVSVLLGLLAIVKSAQYYLGTFQLNFSARGAVTGASYTDVHAQLPALRLLAIVSIVSAILFLVNIRVRTVRLPLAAIGIWILVAVLAGGVWPWWVQRFSVAPQEAQRERPYIARNIAATRAAFGLTDVATLPYPATPDLTSQEIEANQSLLRNVRLWDPDLLQRGYEQLQAIRTYYRFEDVDIDRYVIDGEVRQVLLGLRELSLDDLPEEARNWTNEHLQYTHGFGLVASLANETTTAGQPQFLVRDVPGTSVPGAEALDPDEPRLYYGEAFQPTEYSIVNSGQAEIDFETGEETQRSSYAGEGGVSIGGFLGKLAFAIREGDPNIVLSDLITPESRILLYRNVRDRVLRAAPFLSLDHDPYPAVVDGRVVWILDAYTSSAFYPYSQRFDLGEIIGSEEAGALEGRANYLRNSVKVVVDAYDGTMDFYVVDPDDPLVQAWRNAFPDLFTDEEPSDDLRAHFRYPEDLFNVQSDVYLTYHMDDPIDFYSRLDAWAVPENPVAAGSSIDRPTLVPPTYLLLQLPGDTEESFLLTRPFTPRARPNMIATLVARSDPENYGELITLQFPRQIQVAGPAQVENLINQETEISESLSLLRRGGSRVDFGSLVILPIEDSILYVQPIFVTASGQTTTGTTGIPEMKRVVLVLGERVVMEDDFDSALASLFDLDAPVAVEPGDEPTEGEPGAPAEPTDPQLAALVERAGDLYARAQEALAAGDFETYGALIEQLGDVLAEARELSGGDGTGDTAGAGDDAGAGGAGAGAAAPDGN
ncbi:MAG TPA: UPF0182 family protein [Actinomycetota bacterium]|nr:UPF0182 family protein [Actinomycetota bacterium]